MKPNIIVGVLLACGAGQVMAACATPALSASQISALLENPPPGKYACASRVAGGNDKWNELHQAGIITDYKKGPGDPIDPTKVMGTYTINNNGGNNLDTITYNYGTGGSYTYSIKSTGASTGNAFHFCNIQTFELILVVVQANPTPC